MIAIRLDRSEFTEPYNRIAAQMKNPRAVSAAAGRGIGNLLKKHFRRKDQSEANSLSSRREHFWLKVGQGVQNPVIDSSGRTVSVDISHPAIRQKVKGGTIRAKRTRNLAIPIDPDAYGRAPATFEKETGLELVFIAQKPGRGTALLVTAADQGMQVRYLLKQSVTQKADPTALPPAKEMEDEALKQAAAALKRELRKPGPST